MVDSRRAPAGPESSAMPLYHFHIHDGVSTPDVEGTELGNVEQAREQAVRLAGELLCMHPRAFWQGDEWVMEVTDHDGLMLFTITFFVTDAPASSRRR
jgi:hypothetical protein